MDGWAGSGLSLVVKGRAIGYLNVIDNLIGRVGEMWPFPGKYVVGVILYDPPYVHAFVTWDRWSCLIVHAMCCVVFAFARIPRYISINTIGT